MDLRMTSKEKLVDREEGAEPSEGKGARNCSPETEHGLKQAARPHS